MEEILMAAMLSFPEAYNPATIESHMFQFFFFWLVSDEEKLIFRTRRPLKYLI